jgi:hypothetical protein
MYKTEDNDVRIALGRNRGGFDSTGDRFVCDTSGRKDIIVINKRTK